MQQEDNGKVCEAGGGQWMERQERWSCRVLSLVLFCPAFDKCLRQVCLSTDEEESNIFERAKMMYTCCLNKTNEFVTLRFCRSRDV